MEVFTGHADGRVVDINETCAIYFGKFGILARLRTRTRKSYERMFTAAWLRARDSRDLRANLFSSGVWRMRRENRAVLWIGRYRWLHVFYVLPTRVWFMISIVNKFILCLIILPFLTKLPVKQRGNKYCIVVTNMIVCWFC